MGGLAFVTLYLVGGFQKMLRSMTKGGFKKAKFCVAYFMNGSLGGPRSYDYV